MIQSSKLPSPIEFPSLEEIESRAQEIGKEIFSLSSKSSSQSWWYQTMMSLATKDPRVKTQLFRFVDVLPVLKTHDQKVRQLLEYLSRPKNHKHWPIVLSCCFGYSQSSWCKHGRWTRGCKPS